MKTCRTFFRCLRDAFKSVFRNFSLSLASVSCITITLIIIAAALLLSDNVQNFTKEIERDVTIVAFLKSDVSSLDRENFESAVKTNSNIDTFTYKSKADVKKDMQKENDTFSSVLAEWDDANNPLKDTYTIKVRDVKKIGETAKELESINCVSTVQYGEGLVEKLVGVFDAIKKITYAIALSLIVVTVFLIINTIKLTIFSRKREISIMRLVGASNFTIKTPFIIEGMILGMLGSLLPIGLIIFGYPALYDKLGGYVFSPLVKLIGSASFVYTTSLIVLVIGIIVGMMGSASAVRKYLKV